MRWPAPVLAALVLLTLPACGVQASSDGTVDELNDAAKAQDAEALGRLLAEPSAADQAVLLNQAVGNVAALVDPAFSASDRNVLLNGEPFGTTSENGVVAGSPAVVLLDEAMGWHIENASAGKPGEYILLPGGTYRLTDTGSQELFRPVLDGEPTTEDSVELTVAANDRVSVQWQPTDEAIRVARTTAGDALNSCADGCPTASKVEVATTEDIDPTGLSVEAGDSTTITLSAASVPVNYDEPFTPALDTVEGTATFTVPVTFDGVEPTVGDVTAVLD